MLVYACSGEVPERAVLARAGSRTGGSGAGGLQNLNMLIYACIWLYMFVYASICLPMLVYACICEYLPVYVCICLYMLAYARIC